MKYTPISKARPDDREKSAHSPQNSSLIISLIVLKVTVLTVGSLQFLNIDLWPRIIISITALIVGSVILVANHRLPTNETTNDIQSVDKTDQLLAIDDINEIFGSSLNPDDMFRLMVSKSRDVFDFSDMVFYGADEQNKLYIKRTDGKLAKDLISGRDTEKGLATKSYLSRRTMIDKDMRIDRHWMPNDLVSNMAWSVAAPVSINDDTIGVMQFIASKGSEMPLNIEMLASALVEKFIPFFKNERSFEITFTNAMTDKTTDLPNERAFYMILENQLAESQRSRDDRPLSIITLDIKNFTDFNRSFGHDKGNELLIFVADLIRVQLRKMDFLAKAKGDEFLIVLPTARENIAEGIVARIQEAFETTPFNLIAEKNVDVEMNYGWATFWRDGETAEQLLTHARLRKRHAKTSDPGSVVWFPKDYMN